MYMRNKVDMLYLLTQFLQRLQTKTESKASLWLHTTLNKLYSFLPLLTKGRITMIF